MFLFWASRSYLAPGFPLYLLRRYALQKDAAAIPNAHFIQHETLLKTDIRCSALCGKTVLDI